MIGRIIAVGAALTMVYASALLPAAGSDGKPVNVQKSTLNAQIGTKSAEKVPIYGPIRPVPVKGEENERIEEPTGEFCTDMSGSETADPLFGSTDGTAAADAEGYGEAEQPAADAEAEELDQDPKEVQLSEEDATFDQDTVDSTVESEVVPEPAMEYLGDWTISFYCNCFECCGVWSGGATASGDMPTPWYTVATDGLEFGTILYVDGLGYFEVQDRGTDYGWLDVFVSEHQEADNLGLQCRSVYLVG